MIRNSRWLGGGLSLICVAALVFAPLEMSSYYRSFLMIMLMYVGLALSWNLTSGYTGYLSFGHGVFFGIGCYTFAALVSMYSWPYVPALLAAALAAAVAAFLLGLIFMRVRIRVAYFAIATLGLNEIVRTIVSTSEWLGSAHGMTLPSPPYRYLLYYIVLAIVLATFAVAAWIDRSAFGLGLRAILQDEEVAEATGVPTFRCKLIAFVLSAIFPGLLGAAIGWHWSYIDPFMAFDIFISFDMSVMVVLGGIGTLWGPVIGAVLMGSLGEVLWVHLPNLHGLIYGLLVTIMVLVAPGGIVQLIGRLHHRLNPVAAEAIPASMRVS